MQNTNKYKDEKFASLIMKYAGEYFASESNKNSLITITKVDILNKGKRAIIYYTILPESEESKASQFITRKRSDFRKFVMSKKSFGFTPSFDFEIDYGEKNRQRIDELLQ